jgi:hypothetical protein
MSARGAESRAGPPLMSAPGTKALWPYHGRHPVSGEASPERWRDNWPVGAPNRATRR